MTRVATIQDPIAAVVAEALSYLGTEEQPRGSNRSTRIDYWLTESGVPVANPWCMAWLWNVGRQALGAANPLPRTALVQTCYEWARDGGLEYATPEVGDLYVRWYPSLNRYAHVGLVIERDGDHVQTLDGNTTDGGSREGYGVLKRRVAVVQGIRFLRWVEALPSTSTLHRVAL